MALINRIDTADTSAIDVPGSIPQTQGPPASPVADQPVETTDPSTAAAKKLESDLEANYVRGQLDKAQPHPARGVLYDQKTKPEPGKGDTATKATGEVPPPPTLGDGTSDELNQQVATAAASMVGKQVVGPNGQDYSKKPDKAECFYMVDVLLRDAGAKSAADFGKITKDADYKWSAKKIDLKDVKPGDVLQFRNQKINITTRTTIKKTFPDGHSVSEGGGSKTQTLSRGFPNHTSIVLANDGDGKMTVAEQHVLDHSTGKESTTVRKNTLYTQDVPATTTKKPTRWEKEGGQDVKIEETTTVTITVEGQISAYRPQQKGK